MIRRVLSIILLTALTSIVSHAQLSRTAAMGGLTYSVIDPDQSLNPYNFGGNPAWLYVDESKTYLKITPFIGNSWGSLRPRFDSEGTFKYGTTFAGVKTLGRNGTFFGYTSYNYENRRNYYRSLKMNNYSGEAFFLTDTTTGNYSYKGPDVILMYSWELLPHLYAGGSINYELLEGLKEVYSYAKTMFRNTGVNLGLAYELGNGMVLGTSFKYTDAQESIEATDVNLLDVEIYNYRGDTYYFIKRTSTVDHKVRKKAYDIRGQFSWSNDKFALAAQGGYSPADTKIIVPYKTFSEDEEGYAAFESYDMQFKAQYKIDDNFLLGATGGYFGSNSWSKISKKELLIWDWDVKHLVAGVGTSYQVNDNLLAAFEYEFVNSNIDSSKYIDRKFLSITSGDHYLRSAIEYRIPEDIFLRLGVNYGIKEYDMYTGYNDCNLFRITGGIGFRLFDIMTIDSFFEYSTINPKDFSGVSRNYYNGGLTITLNKF